MPAADPPKSEPDDIAERAELAPVLKLLEEVRQFRATDSSFNSRQPPLADLATPRDSEQTNTPRSEPHSTAEHDLGSRIDAGDLNTEPKDVEFATGEAELTLGRFRLLERLGQGGFGIVMRAVDTRLGREVAIKLMNLEASLSESATSRFDREAKAAALLSHPNIVPVYESGNEDGIRYLVCEYIRGNNLAHELARVQCYAADEAARLVHALADAMAHAHERGVLHRDLKPANILMDERNGEPRITDFGMAALVDDYQQVTQTGSTIGTPAYMAPEQASSQSDAIGPATDVYGLGAILYQLLTGRAPFTMPSVLETLRAVASTDPPPPKSIEPSVPKDLEAICLKCLEKVPSRRYASATELQSDLARFLARQPVAARPVSSLRRLTRWAERHPALVTATLLFLVTLLSGLAISSWMWRQSYRNWQRAEEREQQLKLEAVARQAALKTVDQQAQQLSALAERLQSAIDRLFFVVAESPEIQTTGAEPLRLRLLEAANEYYSDIVQSDLFPAESNIEPSPLKTAGGSMRRETDAKLAHTLLSLGTVFYQLGDYAQAYQITEQLLARLPTGNSIELRSLRSETHALAARACLSQKLTDQAFKHIEQCLSQAGTAFANEADKDTVGQHRLSARALAAAALVYSIDGQRTMANQYALQAVAAWKQIGDGNTSATDLRDRATTTVLAARALAASETKEEAKSLLASSIPTLEAGLKHTSQLPGTIYQLAEAYRVRGFLHGKDWSAAEPDFRRSAELYEQLVTRHPLVPNYQLEQLGLEYSYGLSEYLNGHLDPAKQRFERILERGEQLSARFPQNTAATLAPTGNALTMLAFIHRRLGDLASEQATLERALELNQQRAQLAGYSPASQVAIAGVLGEIAVCLSNQGLHEQAVERFDESDLMLTAVIENDAANGEATRFLSNNLYNSHESLVALQRYEDAYQRVEKSAELQPDPTVLCKLAEISASGSQWERAVQCVQTFQSQTWSTPDQLQQAILAQWKLLDHLQPQELEITERGVLIEMLREHTLSALQQLAENSEQPSAAAALDSLKNSELYRRIAWPALQAP